VGFTQCAILWRTGRVYDIISLHNVNNIECIINNYSLSGYEMIDSQSHKVHNAQLDIIISHPTSTSGKIVLLKTPHK